MGATGYMASYTVKGLGVGDVVVHVANRVSSRRMTGQAGLGGPAGSGCRAVGQGSVTVDAIGGGSDHLIVTGRGTRMTHCTSSYRAITVNIDQDTGTGMTSTGGTGVLAEVNWMVPMTSGLIGMTIKTADGDGVVLDYRLNTGITRADIRGTG